MSGVDAAFGNWLAGFSDGEGCFYLHNSAGSYRAVFRLKLRADDVAVLNEICEKTGLGYVKSVKPGKKNTHPLSEWLVITKDDCSALVKIFTAFPLRAKKSRDFDIWKTAVALLQEVRHIRPSGVGTKFSGSKGIPIRNW